jgi:hypothetical protein
MVLDEVSGHSWIMIEGSHAAMPPEKGQALDEALVKRLHQEPKEKDTRHRYMKFILKSTITERETKVKVLGTQRLYRRKGAIE